MKALIYSGPMFIALFFLLVFYIMAIGSGMSVIEITPETQQEPRTEASPVSGGTIPKKSSNPLRNPVTSHRCFATKLSGVCVMGISI